MIKLTRRRRVGRSEEAATTDGAQEPVEPATAAQNTRDADSPSAAGETESGSRPDVLERPRSLWARVLAYGVLPAAVLLLAIMAGLLKWQDESAREAQACTQESVQAAKDSTIAMLSYRANTVADDLSAARDRLTGTFRDAYTDLTKNVVVPGARQQQIRATASVRAAGSVSANRDHAVVVVFVNQTTTVGQTTPTDSASVVRVTMDRVEGHWLVSGFDPI